jgi:hypothetical protein
MVGDADGEAGDVLFAHDLLGELIHLRIEVWRGGLGDGDEEEGDDAQGERGGPVHDGFLGNAMG